MTTVQFSLHSKPVVSVVDFGLLERSLLFAELSNVSYLKKDIACSTAADIGFPHAEFIDRDGSQAFIFENDNDCVIACRGTEPTEWNDIKADIDAVSVAAETMGRVHRGFKKEVDDLWPILEGRLISNQKPCGSVVTH